MIAMSITRTCHEHRRDRIARAPVHPVPAQPLPEHPVRRALLRALSMLGLGVGGVAAVDDDEPLGIG